MICPKCGRPVDTNAVICAGCDFILETDFLGTEILDEEKELRPGAGGVDPASFNLADAVILGDIEGEAQSFETGDSGFHVRESTNARLYVSGRSQAMMAPDAIPDRTGSAGDVRLTPFERHVLSFIDGKRPVEIIRREAGLDEVEVKTALATLADKGVVAVVGRTLLGANNDTHPRRRRARRRHELVGLLGSSDETDRAIEEAFRTQTNMRALGAAPAEEKSVVVPPPGVFASDEMEEETHSQFPADLVSEDSETTGLRDPRFDEDLPSDADSFTVPGLTGEIRADMRPVAATIKSVLASSDGFDDFGDPSEIATDLIEPVYSSGAYSIGSMSGMSVRHPPDFASEAPTGSLDPISFASETSVPLSLLDESDLSSMEASAVRARNPGGGIRRPMAAAESDISFIDEDDIVRSAIARAGADEDVTGHWQQLDSQATGLVSAPPDLPSAEESVRSLLPVMSQEGSATGAYRQPAAEGNETFVLSGSPSVGSIASDSHGPWATPAEEKRIPVVRGPGTGAARRAERARKHYEDALADYDQGRVGAAFMNVKLACVYAPDNEEYKSTALMWERQNQQSRTGQDESDESTPEFARLYERATRYEQAGDFQNAIHTLEDAAELFPNIAAIHNRLGVILALRRQQFDDAVASIRRAIEIDPDNLHYKSNLGKVEIRRRRAAS